MDNQRNGVVREMSDDLLNDLDYMAMNAVIKGSTPERAAARIRELERQLQMAEYILFLLVKDKACCVGDAVYKNPTEAARAFLGRKE